MMHMAVQLISESSSSVPAASAPAVARRPEAAIHAAARLPSLREQLGYATDADLIAELREVLALNAATRFAKPVVDDAAGEPRTGSRKRAPR